MTFHEFCEGLFISSKKRTRFFQNTRISEDSDGFLSETKGFLPKVYEIFLSESVFIQVPALHRIFIDPP